MGIIDWVRDRLTQDIENMQKADADSLPDKPTSQDSMDREDFIGRKAILTDPYFEQVQTHNVYRHKISRITNKTLRDVSVRDWLVSAIIQARCDTMLLFSRPQHKQFDTGFKIVKRQQHETLSVEEQEEIANLEAFITNCGRIEGTPPEGKMLFGEFLKLTCRDALTFGHVAVEKVKTRMGGLHSFRPLPAESVYHVSNTVPRETLDTYITQAQKMRALRDKLYTNDPTNKYEVPERDISYYKYVQMSHDQQVLAAFGDEDMIFKLFNAQNFIDSMGYCYSPLELAIINVTSHLNIESYNSQFFTHGYAARGILHLKGTVTNSQMLAFRRQFHNTISGTQHAWKTPIIAGLDDIQWIPLSASAREMEYLNFNNHVMRAICTQFQIDPIELGLDMLTSGNNRGPSQQANNEYKINYSRERGLYPILMMFEDLVNGYILPALDEGLANKYMFKFVGYTDETPQTHIAQLQAEMTVFSTLNDLLKSSGKTKMEHPIADLPLNATFWQLVEKNMTRGEIREAFLGDKGASSRPELQYIPSDPAFLGWQQMLLTINRTKKQEKLEQQQQDMEAEQNSRDKEKHNADMAETNARHAHAVTNHESVKDAAKSAGAASEPLHIGGRTISNPINVIGDEE